MRADELRTKILVRDVMNSPVITAAPDDFLDIVAQKMAEHKVGSIVIADGGELKGIVTDGDIVAKAVAKNLQPHKVKAKDVMSTPLITIDAESDVTEAARLMRKHKVKRLGVVYRGDVVGMVSVSDVIAVTPELVDVLSEKTKILTSERIKVRGYVAGYCDACNQWSDYLQEVDGKFLCEECRSGLSKEK